MNNSTFANMHVLHLEVELDPSDLERGGCTDTDGDRDGDAGHGTHSVLVLLSVMHARAMFQAHSLQLQC